MNKIYLFTALFILLALTASAQIYEEVSVSAGYSNTTFYNIKDGSTTSIAHTDWDIAFGLSPQGAGIFVNEAIASSMSAPLPETELYLTSSTDFADFDSIGMERIFNNENSWELGAFNHVGEATDPFDFGWGAYSTQNNQVNSTRIFCIKLRDSSYKKLEIQSLIQGIYTFRYADLDGSNEVVQMVDKADYSNKTLAYYSFTSESVLDLEPENWDFAFTRYYTTLDDGQGGVIDYLVTGMLSNQGVRVAEATGVDPETVSAADYEDAYSEDLTIVGYDWKYFDLATFSWVIPEDLVYFVKTNQSEIYKIQLIDFTGSSAGTATIAKTFLSETTAVEETAVIHVEEFTISPNPATSFINVNFSLEKDFESLNLMINNALGQIIKHQEIAVVRGGNTVNLPLDLAGGVYFVSLQSGKSVLTKQVIIK
ncbi:MAG: hypothetical protein ACI85O_002093 [Saprospiraceae bacterium]|jgi:hypothetical protein